MVTVNAAEAVHAAMTASLRFSQQFHTCLHGMWVEVGCHPCAATAWRLPSMCRASHCEPQIAGCGPLHRGRGDGVAACKRSNPQPLDARHCGHDDRGLLLLPAPRASNSSESCPCVGNSLVPHPHTLDGASRMQHPRQSSGLLPPHRKCKNPQRVRWVCAGPLPPSSK